MGLGWGGCSYNIGQPVTPSLPQAEALDARTAQLSSGALAPSRLFNTAHHWSCLPAASPLLGSPRPCRGASPCTHSPALAFCPVLPKPHNLGLNRGDDAFPGSPTIHLYAYTSGSGSTYHPGFCSRRHGGQAVRAGVMLSLTCTHAHTDTPHHTHTHGPFPPSPQGHPRPLPRRVSACPFVHHWLVLYSLANDLTLCDALCDGPSAPSPSCSSSPPKILDNAPAPGRPRLRLIM